MKMSSSAAPANKRQRTSSSAVDAANGDDEDDDDDDLLKLLNGHDEFVSPEQRQEDEAAQRRAARRKRLRQQAQQQQQQQQPGDDGSGTDPLLSKKPVAKEDNGNNTKMIMDVDDDKQEAAAVTGADFITKGAGGPDNYTVDESVADDGQQNQMNNNDDNDDDNDDDEFDMFSSSVSPPPAAPAIVTTALTTTSEAAEVLAANKKPTSSSHQQRGHEHQQDWDDAEGYYKAVIGETIALQIQTTTTTTTSSSSDNASTAAAATIMFRVLGVVGKGVFSTVLKCTTISNSSSYVLPPTVALKCIRHNESMTKAAQAEIRCLQQLNGCPGVVPLLLPQHDNHQNTTASSGGAANNNNAIQYLEHCGHLILVFPFMEYNLRDVLQKFGKGVGLSLQAVRSYAGQLLAAATHLKKHCLLHLDLKPDNILVSADFSTVQLADFGSVWMNAGTTDPNSNSSSSSNMTTTPYLVSRFYRAPEIILGLTPLTFAVDLWSLAVTVAEVFLGRVLFHGNSNNDMLYVFMQHLGPFSNRVIRQHLVSCQKHGSQVVARHFQQEATNYVFLQQTVDAVTGEAVHKVLSLQQQQQQSQNGKNKNKFPLATPLRQKLLQAKSAKDSRALVIQFADLLQKALALDPTRRISLKEALQHEFFQD